MHTYNSADDSLASVPVQAGRRSRHSSALPTAGSSGHAPLERTSLRGAAYGALKRRILQGELAPGVALVPEELAAALGVSRTPVREALALLARDRLVVVAPNGTSRVAEPSAAYVADMMDVRQRLESWAAAEASARAPRAEIEALLARWEVAADRLRRTGDDRLAPEVDAAMHQLVLRWCGNQALRQVLAPFADHVAWVRAIGFQHRQRAGGDLQEQKAILDALAAGDRDRASAAMAAHIQTAKQRLLAILTARAASEAAG